MVAEGYTIDENFAEKFNEVVALLGILGGGDGSRVSDASEFLDSISLKELFNRSKKRRKGKPKNVNKKDDDPTSGDDD